jgi:probable HAF family extracellular repeat protein
MAQVDDDGAACEYPRPVTTTLEDEMKRLRVCVVAALGSFASFVVAATLVAQSSVIDIGTLGPESSFLWAVNNRNQAVGWSELAGRDTEHAILWQGGELIDLGALPGDTASRGYAINERGQIVGISVDHNLARAHAARWDDGQITNLTLPGAHSCYAFDINNRGEVAGACDLDAVVWTGDAVQRLPLPAGYTWGSAAAINNAGVIAGTMQLPSGPRVPVRWRNGEPTPLPLPPGATGASAEDINASGTIVGYVTFATGIEPAIWEGDSVAPLSGTWAAFSGIAWGINNRGDVVVNGHNLATDEGGGFVWHQGRFHLLEGSGSAHDINEAGVAVGRITIQGSEEHGAVWPKALTRIAPSRPR